MIARHDITLFEKTLNWKIGEHTTSFSVYDSFLSTSVLLNVRYAHNMHSEHLILELETNLREDFTITEKGLLLVESVFKTPLRIKILCETGA